MHPGSKTSPAHYELLWALLGVIFVPRWIQILAVKGIEEGHRVGEADIPSSLALQLKSILPLFGL
jgi:hypothetical protein